MAEEGNLVAALEVEPELRFRSGDSFQPKGHFCGDAAASRQNFGKGGLLDAEEFGHPVGGQAEGFHEVFSDGFAGMGMKQGFGAHG